MVTSGPAFNITLLGCAPSRMLAGNTNKTLTKYKKTKKDFIKIK
jgi:hypothetical protein